MIYLIFIIFVSVSVIIKESLELKAKMTVFFFFSSFVKNHVFEELDAFNTALQNYPGSILFLIYALGVIY